MHSTHQPSPSQSVLVRSSLCIPPTGNPSLQSVRVCPTSASATTVHCVFHLPQSELVLSISIPVNKNHLCSPHNRQPDRNQCLWIPWCAFCLFNRSQKLQRLPFRNPVFLFFFTSFRLVINSFVSSFSSSFLATACGSSFPTHKWHLPPSCSWPPLSSSPQPRHCFPLTELHVLSTAPLGDYDLRSGVSSGFPALRRVAASVSSTSVFLIA